jgi:hypothetical protein
MPGADHLGKLVLEGVDIRAQRGNPVGPKRLVDEIPLGLAHMRRRQQDLIVDAPSFDQIDHPSGPIHHWKMVDRVLLHYLQRIAPGPVFRHDDRAPFRDDGERLVQRSALEQQPAQVAVGYCAFELTIAADEQNDTETTAIEHVEGVAQRGLACDADSRNIQATNPSANFAGGHTRIDHSGRYVDGNGGAGADRRAITNRDAGKYIRSRANENPRSEPYIAGQRCTRRNMAVVADHAFMIDDRAVIDDPPFADRGGRRDDGTGGHERAVSDRGTPRDRRRRMDDGRRQAAARLQRFEYPGPDVIATDRYVKALSHHVHGRIEALHSQPQDVFANLARRIVDHADLRLHSARLQCVQHHHAVAAGADQEKLLNRHWFLPSKRRQDRCRRAR